MTFWDNIRNLAGLRGLTIIGASDIIASGIGSIFWFYMASLLGAENYGQISYFLSITSIASTIALLGATDTLSVYIPKDIKLESTLYTLTIGTGLALSVISFLIFTNIGISVYILGAVVFGLS